VILMTEIGLLAYNAKEERRLRIESMRKTIEQLDCYYYLIRIILVILALLLLPLYILMCRCEKKNKET